MLPNCSGPSNAYVFSGFDSKLAGISATLIGFLGFSLNLVIVLASLNYKKLRYDVTTPFILSLTTSDLLFSSLTLPILAIRFFSEDWIVGETLCRLFPLIFYGNSAVTLFSLLAVTIHRWVMIYFPDRSSQIFSRARTKIMIIFCWVSPVLLLCPSLFGIWGSHDLECHTRSCTIQETHGSSPKIFFLLLGLLLPSFTLFIANTMIFVKVAMVRRRMAQYVSNPSKALKKREQKLTKMMCTIFFCFALSYFPAAIIKVFDGDETMPHLHIITYIVNWLTVIMNPVIYVISNDKYRLAIHFLFQRCCCMQKGSNSMALQQEGVRSSTMSEDENEEKSKWKSVKKMVKKSSIRRGSSYQHGKLISSQTSSSITLKKNNKKITNEVIKEENPRFDEVPLT
ncbi:protein trapped in endoderm-1 [Lepeophtheirus salmonis]|uniref:protein trapped in endoderm-1 n=1 Tax=Lepeophtheirus salmonis TaxID=72036 RepID=UPI001AE1E608|nr:protein trapped in endoderm-1-like [Lepeophtheirus salmonis]